MTKKVRVPGDVSFRFKSAAGEPFDGKKALFTADGASYNTTADAVVIAQIQEGIAHNVFIARRESEIIDSIQGAGFQHVPDLEVPLIAQKLG
ncbi:MAG: hypothetical protein WC043_03840 [Pseudobdellovibrionaceae bacterium]